MAYTMILHQLTHSGDRACTVLAVCEEEVRHHLPLQIHLLLHMAGGVAGHVGVKPHLELAQL